MLNSRLVVLFSFFLPNLFINFYFFLFLLYDSRVDSRIIKCSVANINELCLADFCTDAFTYLEYSFSSGYFSVPRKSMCSQKCATPDTSQGSFKCPEIRNSDHIARIFLLLRNFNLPHWTESAAAALSASGSDINSTLSSLASSRPRYCNYGVKLDNQ